MNATTELSMTNSSAHLGMEPLAQALQLTVSIFNGFIFLAGVAGHTLVMFLLLRRKKHHDGTTTLFLNLSVADILQLTCMPFNVISIAMRTWVFGKFLCKLVNFLNIMCSSACVFTLAGISIIRYISIVNPYKPHRFQVSCYLVLVISTIWLPAFALAIPQFFYRSVWSDSMYCFALLTDETEITYSVSLFLCAFTIPLITITIMYSKILTYLKTKRLNMKTSYLDRHHAQITRLSITLVLAFITCWFPSYVLRFLVIGRQVDIQGVFPALAWILASSSTIMNPIAYMLTSKQFRKDMWALLCKDCRAKQSNKVSPMTLDGKLPTAASTRYTHSS